MENNDTPESIPHSTTDGSIEPEARMPVLDSPTTPKVAETIEEATAPCTDCGAEFPNPHRDDCPQLEGQAAIQEGMDKEEGEKTLLKPSQALKHIKLYMAKVERYLNPELIKQLSNEGNIHEMFDDLIKIAKMGEDKEEAVKAAQQQ